MQLSKNLARNLKNVVNCLATVFLCAAVLLFAVKANAQANGTANIQGTITDATGAVLPNATVTLTEELTHVARVAKTNSSGFYVFPNINVGTYTLNVTAPTFEAYTLSGNVLEIGSSISLNVKMKGGSTSETVEVKAQGLALQTEDTEFKQTVDHNELLEMPLQGRHMTDLIILAGGSNTSGVQDATGSKFTYQSVTISVAGASGNSISYRLDGGDNQDYMGGGNNPLPFPDAISQFSVETATMGAQEGVHSGGMVNVVTQSGTNKYHGSAFEFIRNNYIDATNFFTNPCTAGQKPPNCGKDTLHQNQYGGTLGGPVRIPGLFDGRDKLFFFAGFQHTKNDQATATSSAFLPTAANLNGDFSTTDYLPPPQTPNKNICSNAIQLYDPITGVPLPNNKYGQAGGPALPTWNPQAINLLQYLPYQNVPTPGTSSSYVIPVQADGTDVCGHVTYAIPSKFSDNEFDTRVDYSINAKNSLYARYFIDSYQQPSFFSPTNILLTTQSGNPEQRYQTITFGENFTVSSNIINSVHLTAVRRLNHRGYAAGDINANTLGVTIFQVQPIGLFLTASHNSHGFNIGGDSNSLAVLNDNTPIDFADDLTIVHGKHQIALGVGYVRNQLNVNNAYRGNGVFNFLGTYSGNAGGAGGATVGDANLDVLEGAMNPGSSGFQQSKAQQNALRGSIPTVYAQDIYHATHRLTLIAGLRWQPLYYPVDYFHRGTTFDMGAFLTNQISTTYPGAPAGSGFYGDAGVPAAITKNSPWNFNPNVGASYDVFGTGKTVIRGGLAFEFDQPNFFSSQRLQQNPPFATQTTPNTGAQLCFSHPWVIGGTGNGCAATGGTNTSPFPQPQVPTPSTAIFPAQSQYIVLQPQYQAPSTLQWTASIQQQLPHSTTLQIQYIGSRTRNLLMGVPLDAAVFIPGNFGAGGTGCTLPNGTGLSATPFTTPFSYTPGASGTPCSTTGNQQARFALNLLNLTQGNQYLGGGGGSLRESNSGYATYNGMIISLNHRLSSTFSLSTNYTFSKCLNNDDPQGDISGTQLEDPNNPRRDYGRCSGETRHIFNTQLVAKSAFAVRGITGYLINGWAFSPLIHITSGQPINVSAGSDGSLTDVGNDRPNQIPGVNPYHFVKINRGTSNQANREYLNTAAFCTYNQSTVTFPYCTGFVPAAGTFGNVGRNSFNGPMFFQMDANFTRTFPLPRKFSLYTRLDAFNVLNHPNFSNPGNSNPTTSGFGLITSTTGPASANGLNARVFQVAAKIIF
jgi:hypothetical protein